MVFLCNTIQKMVTNNAMGEHHQKGVVFIEKDVVSGKKEEEKKKETDCGSEERT